MDAAYTRTLYYAHNTCAHNLVSLQIYLKHYAIPGNFNTHTHTHKTLVIKVWVLADSRNGYFHTLQVYTGKEGSGEKQLGQRVVKDLTRLLKGKNHHVFFDNFFTSEELLQDLLKDDIFACGTA